MYLLKVNNICEHRYIMLNFNSLSSDKYEFEFECRFLGKKRWEVFWIWKRREKMPRIDPRFESDFILCVLNVT